MTADVFSWNELPELMAAEELFDTAVSPGADRSSLAAQADEDDFEDDDDDDEEEDDDD